MSSYTKDSINEVKNAANVLDVVSEFVSLVKNGKNYKGRCPFHNEKTPSFVVSPDKGIYHCFGCHKSGNAVTFLMEYNSYSYIESIEYLARRYGVSLDEENKKQSPATTKRELVYKVLDSICYFFQENLEKDKSQKAKSFFAKREFTNETIKQFRLGYSQDSWDAGMKFLENQGYSYETLEEAGLIIPKDKGNGYYDRFRDRAMFPIRDIMGRVVAFGARDLAQEQKSAKYINSPETGVYSKSKILYGLYESKSSIRDKRFAIMTEGYADVITLHQAGITNTVASSGTALTKDQLKLLSQYTNEIVFIFDSDSAGQKATERGIEFALEDGFNISIVNLPDGEDPDSIVRSRGRQAFEYFLDRKINFIKFKINIAKEKLRFENPSEKSGAVREIIDIIYKIPDALQHDFYLSDLANNANVSESTLRKIYAEKVEKEVQQEYKSKNSEKLDYISSQEIKKEYEDIEQYIHKITKGIDFSEMILIRYCLLGFNELNHLFDELQFNTDLCNTDKGREILTALSMIQDSGLGNLENEIMESLEIQIEIKNELLALIILNTVPMEDFRKAGMLIEDFDYASAAIDCITKLKADQIQKKINILEIQAKTKETYEEKLEIAKEINILKSEVINMSKMELYIARENS